MGRLSFFCYYMKPDAEASRWSRVALSGLRARTAASRSDCRFAFGLSLRVIASGTQWSAAIQGMKPYSLDCFVPCKCSAFDVVNDAKRVRSPVYWIASFLAMTRSDNRVTASLRSRMRIARVGAKPRGVRIGLSLCVFDSLRIVESEICERSVTERGKSKISFAECRAFRRSQSRGEATTNQTNPSQVTAKTPFWQKKHLLFNKKPYL